MFPHRTLENQSPETSTKLKPSKQPANMSSAALNKIAANSPSRQSPSDIETSIANALYDLEQNIPDMRAVLRPLQFVSAREVRLFTVKTELQTGLLISVIKDRGRSW
jgi:hypothetical protein